MSLNLFRKSKMKISLLFAYALIALGLIIGFAGEESPVTGKFAFLFVVAGIVVFLFSTRKDTGYNWDK